MIEQGGDYVLALQGNQATLYEDVTLFLENAETALDEAETVDGEHGRIELRRAAVSRDIGWLQEMHAWPGLQAIGKVTARRETAGTVSRKRSESGP